MTDDQAINQFCRRLIANGFSTGHGSDWRDIAEECLINMIEMRDEIRARSEAEKFRQS